MDGRKDRSYGRTEAWGLGYQPVSVLFTQITWNIFQACLAAYVKVVELFLFFNYFYYFILKVRVEKRPDFYTFIPWLLFPNSYISLFEKAALKISEESYYFKHVVTDCWGWMPAVSHMLLEQMLPRKAIHYWLWSAALQVADVI